jgi:hypothetical protein
LKSSENPAVIFCHKEAQKFTKTSNTGLVRLGRILGGLFCAFLWPNQKSFSAYSQEGSSSKPA